MNLRFENDVKTYGTETSHMIVSCCPQFENDVKTYGTETDLIVFLLVGRLRMM